ncbi:MAG: FadR family transcriptional regulator [Alphaproteobacteria bacterium HGW-Alphaproteobacteria-2]|nr:MAG: FadR family transcriptional regulator [Alphaproteobacteria bacterium HGW-Alphaproteobacteria-2]
MSDQIETNPESAPFQDGRLRPGTALVLPAAPATRPRSGSGDEAGLAGWLQGKAVGGWHRPGERLPTERTLARQFGVSRATVRRVLGRMEQEGLIYRRVGSGTFIAERPVQPQEGPTWRDTGPKELMEARLTVEPRLARVFVENARPGDVERVRLCVERSEASRSFEEFELWDESLHEALVAGTHNRLLIEWYAMITAARREGRWTILDALDMRSADAAASAVQVHLAFIREGLFDLAD